MFGYKMFYSERDIPLVYVRDTTYDPPNFPILTIENYCKWYSLYLVHPNGKVEKIQFPNLPEDLPTGCQAGYSDHIPNPVAVRYMADKHGWFLDEQSWEMIAGRWCCEHLDVKEIRDYEEEDI